MTHGYFNTMSVASFGDATPSAGLAHGRAEIDARGVVSIERVFLDDGDMPLAPNTHHFVDGDDGVLHVRLFYGLAAEPAPHRIHHILEEHTRTLCQRHVRYKGRIASPEDILTGVEAWFD